MAQPLKRVYAEWSQFADEAKNLDRELECFEEMQMALKQLRTLVNASALSDSERRALCYQLAHMQYHFTQSFNALVADALLKQN